MEAGRLAVRPLQESQRVLVVGTARDGGRVHTGIGFEGVVGTAC